MRLDPQRGEGRARFLFGVLLPVILSVVVTFGFVAWLIYLSASKSDEQAAAREQTLVRHFLDQQQEVLSDSQFSVVAWDEAVEAVSEPFDEEWVSINLGEDLYFADGIDMVYVLDASLTPVFAMFEGDAIAPSTFSRNKDALTPLAERLREINWQGALSAFVQRVSNVLPSVADTMLIEGKPALVSLMPITSDTGKYGYSPGSEFIHVAIRFLDSRFADEVNDRMLVSGGHFDSLDAPINQDETSIPVLNRAGQPIAKFTWKPGQPGANILSDSLPAMLGGFTIMLAVVAFLIFDLSRSTRQIEAGRVAAQHMAFHDKLTGLANRALFEDRLSTAIASARRGPKGIALMIIDLDRFKEVNDTFGHEAGDDLIKQVAQRMQPLLRETDTIARLGGDEFAVIQTDVADIADVTLVADRIIRSIAAPFEVAHSQAFVGASIGIATAPGDALASVELARKADIALYEAKSGGRNRYRIFEDRMSETVRRRQTIEEELRIALSGGGGLEVDFVPLVRGDGVEIAGVTAEIVWNHETLGTVERDRFIPVAESCGLIEPLGEFVLNHACRFGAANPGLRVCVHAYAAQLRNPLFFDKIFSILDETGMKPADLELEICEKMMSPKEAAAASSLRKLSGVGVNIALGDFGSGFRALALLQKFEVDRIKIDRAFFDQLADCPDPEAITHAVVWLARAIGVEVSAEGVDTIDQKNFLYRMGVMSFQGKVFAPENQAEILLEAMSRVPEHHERKLPQDDIELWG